MSTYSQHPQPAANKSRKGWLIGCGVVIVLMCMAGFLIIGGFAGLIALFGGEPDGLRVDVSISSSRIEVGEPFTIDITLANEGQKNIKINEIRLPNILLENALVTEISPSGTLGLDYGTQTAYLFDLNIAPTGSETVVFNLEAIRPEDITGNIDVPVGTKANTTRVRVLISEAAVVSEEIIPQDTTLPEVIPYRSVVQIIAMVESGGEWIPAWGGSGTIISEDGLILTNDHVIADPYIPNVQLVVAITEQQDQPPVPMFYADVLQADYYLDLAVIKIRSDLDGNPVNLSALGLMPVPFGISDDLELGDSLVIIGYPGIGGQTITLTRGEVSGFTAESPYGNRAFIKTSATIAGGNSGGLAATPQGEIIGVPTQLGSGDIEAGFVDCRTLVDTNRDGVIDENDHCIPLGGFINALRPIALAQPMIQAAIAGEVAINRPFGDSAHEEYEVEGDLLLEEYFENNTNQWIIGSGEYGSSDIRNGQLVIDVDLDNYLVWSTMLGDFNSQVIATEVSLNRPVGDGEFGLVCGYVDIENFIIFLVSEDGYYTIYKYEDDQEVFLVEWTYSDFVAESTSYFLAAYCGPDGLAFALNDVLLADVYDPNYVPGEVGVIAKTYETPGLVIGFDSFFIIEP